MMPKTIKQRLSILLIIFFLIGFNVSFVSGNIFSELNTVKLKVISCESNCFDSNLSDDPPWEGYTLIAPEYHTDAYLLNNEKEIVHTWQTNQIQALGTYLLEDGHLIRTCFPKVNNTKFLGGGRTGRVERWDWDSNLIWEFEYSTDNYCLHHDIEVLPNGNILMVAWELHTKNEVIAAGGDPNLILTDELWSDVIIEVEPTGSSGGNIVWEWHVWDHIIQDYDSSKANYGVIRNHPGLINVNYGGRGIDWNHINSIDYHPGLDQILISSCCQSEIWVIDHSTTTPESAGHSGGRYGRGGDVLYRWGNPEAYDHGTIDDRMLYNQHDASWITSGNPGEGNILVFNNGVNRPEGRYSSVEEIIPPLTNNGHYRYQQDVSYGPDSVEWSYSDGEMYSTILSSAQRLPNGNTLICDGAKGRIMEVTYDKDLIWDYTNLIGFKNNVFKAIRYSLDYPGVSNLMHPVIPQKPKGNHIGSINKDYIFSTKTTDPNDKMVFYQWDLGNQIFSEWIGPYSSGLKINYSCHWSEKGIHSLRVRAKNIDGLISDWSDELTIYIAQMKQYDQPILIKLVNILKQIFNLGMPFSIVS